MLYHSNDHRTCNSEMSFSANANSNPNFNPNSSLNTKSITDWLTSNHNSR